MRFLGVFSLTSSTKKPFSSVHPAGLKLPSVDRAVPQRSAVPKLRPPSETPRQPKTGGWSVVENHGHQRHSQRSEELSTYLTSWHNWHNITDWLTNELTNWLTNDECQVDNHGASLWPAIRGRIDGQFGDKRRNVKLISLKENKDKRISSSLHFLDLFL